MGTLEFDQVVKEFRAGTDWEGIARAHRVNLEKLDADVAQSQEIVEQRGQAEPVLGARGRRRPRVI